MGILRSVGGRGEADLDQRAITTEDDIVDLSELDRSNDQHSETATRQNGAAGPDGPAAAISADRAPGEMRPSSDGRGPESDEDFDRWAAHHAPRLATPAPASTPGTPRPANEARELQPGRTPETASRGVPLDDSTVPVAISARGRHHRTSLRSLPPARLARPAAALTALALAAGATTFAIDTLTSSGPRPLPQVATSNGAAPSPGESYGLGDSLTAAIATIAPELRALVRAVPAAHRSSHVARKPPRHHATLPARASQQQQAAAATARSTTAATTTTAAAAEAQTSTSPPRSAPSSTSHTTAGPQTSASHSSPPAGPIDNGPLGGIGQCVKGCT